MASLLQVVIHSLWVHLTLKKNDIKILLPSGIPNHSQNSAEKPASLGPHIPGLPLPMYSSWSSDSDDLLTKQMSKLKNKYLSKTPSGRTGIKTDIENGLEDMRRGKGKLGRSERLAWAYIDYQM